MIRILSAALWLLLLASHQSHSQTGAPCDASKEVRQCRAQISLEGNFVILRSNTPQCSRIDWRINGSLRTTTVIDGEERLEVLTSDPQSLAVEQCVEVRDLRQIRGESPSSSGGESLVDDRECAAYQARMQAANAEYLRAAERMYTSEISSEEVDRAMTRFSSLVPQIPVGCSVNYLIKMSSGDGPTVPVTLRGLPDALEFNVNGEVRIRPR